MSEQTIKFEPESRKRFFALLIALKSEHEKLRLALLEQNGAKAMYILGGIEALTRTIQHYFGEQEFKEQSHGG